MDKAAKQVARALGSLLTTVAMIVTPVPNGSAQGAGIKPPVLQGTTTFSVSRTSTTAVSIPEGVTLRDIDISHRGQGRTRGVLLRKMGSFEQESDRPLLYDLVMRECSQRGCKGPARGSFTVCWCNGPDMSGKWRLYVLADGARVSGSFKIGELNGRSRLQPDERVKWEIRTLEPRIEEQATRTIYSSGAFSSLADVDFGAHVIWVEGDPYAASAMDNCVYDEFTTTPPEEAAFLPACPTRINPYVYTNENIDRDRLSLRTFDAGSPFGLGGWYASASKVEENGSVAVWLDF